MARKSSGKPVGRPTTDFDVKAFNDLIALGCKQEEICWWFRDASGKPANCDTLSRWCERTFGMNYQEYSRQNSGMYLKITLRRNQLKLSEKSAAMAIFLGKNYLGQSDKDSYDVQNTEARTAAINNGQTGTIIEDLTPLANMINNDYEQTTDD